MARRRKKKSGNSLGFVIAGAAVSVLSLGLIGGYIYLRSTATTVALDQDSLCPLIGPKSITAILLDVTDPISDVTALDLRNEFQNLVSSVAQGGLIQVYTLTDQVGQVQRTFSGCNPGDGSTVDEWTSNPRMAQARWEAGFEKPLKQLADHLGKGTEGKQSPIMAAVQRINVEAFGLPEHQNVPKTLVVASDMIEHTASFSMYRDGASFERFGGTEARQKFRSPLSGVDVRVLEFQRPGMTFTDEDLANFWSEWVASNMGELTSFKRLQGVL